MTTYRIICNEKKNLHGQTVGVVIKLKCNPGIVRVHCTVGCTLGSSSS